MHWMSKNTFSSPIRVYVEDTDAGGIVFYANYLKFMERARTEFFRNLGFNKPALFDGLQFVVRELDIVYHQPALLDDIIEVTAEPIKLSRVSVEIAQQVFREGSLLVAGRVKVACIGAESKRPKAIPAEVHSALKNYLR
jgi:4-hydroxybenzoyl-CoA thioesterase